MSGELVPQPKVADNGDQRKPAGAEDAAGEAAKILTMDETLQGIVATNPRGLGVGVGPQLLAAAFADQSHNVDELRKELREVRSRLEGQTAELTQCMIDKARLQERLENMDSARKLRNVASAFAAVMLSVGLKLVDTQTTLAWVLMIFGVVLLISSWFLGSPKIK
jgi:hypothetical protein